MDNVPSSAVLAIVAIVLACIFAAFAFTTMQSEKSSGSNAVVKEENLNAQASEADLTDFDGKLFSGNQVLNALKTYKDEEALVISVESSGSDPNVVFYGNNVEASYYQNIVQDPAGAVGSLAGSKMIALDGHDIKKVDTDSIKKMTDKNDKNYISPSGMFRGTVHRNASNGTIDWIEFKQEN